jgi:hypothetical protein
MRGGSKSGVVCLILFTAVVRCYLMSAVIFSYFIYSTSGEGLGHASVGMYFHDQTVTSIIKYIFGDELGLGVLH